MYRSKATATEEEAKEIMSTNVVKIVGCDWNDIHEFIAEEDF